jgi:hypothetical protein
VGRCLASQHKGGFRGPERAARTQVFTLARKPAPIQAYDVDGRNRFMKQGRAQVPPT